MTVRLIVGLPRLPGPGPAKLLKAAFVRGCDKGVFRICQFSVQGNHVHLVCEARDEVALARGIQGWKSARRGGSTTTGIDRAPFSTTGTTRSS